MLYLVLFLKKNDKDVAYIVNKCFALANIADPDKVPRSVAFHLGFQCLPNIRFMGCRS